MRLYHVSRIPSLTRLMPKAPSNILTHYNMEDGITKRVCFAPSIKSCMRAVGRSFGSKELYVYVPVGINQRYLKKPTVKEVPDAGFTHEIWYLKPVNVKCVAVIVPGEHFDPWVFPIGGSDSAIFGISKGTRYETVKRFRNGKEVKVYKKQPPVEQNKHGLLSRVSGFFRRNK